MKLKSHHRKTVEDGMEIIFKIKAFKYNIIVTKIMDKNRYDIGREESDMGGNTWFENIKEFYSWNNVVKFFEELN
ncbi:MAG: hypothetical protein ACRDDY_03570 [Clostridium sp.]|uniref:hypothetical protein n=1 Tax=Clostridium sp. TaxID=1506 RepID=UPI003EE51B7F